MKRRRTNTGTRTVVQTRVRRPIDKQMVVVAATVTNSQAATTLYTTTYPGTLVGVRWDFTALGLAATAPRLQWAIIITRDGISASMMSQGNGTSFYTPEANVLAFGDTYAQASGIGAGPGLMDFIGTTKSMRKLQAGDVLQCIYSADTANSFAFAGIVQFFIKS